MVIKIEDHAFFFFCRLLCWVVWTYYRRNSLVFCYYFQAKAERGMFIRRNVAIRQTQKRLHGDRIITSKT